MDANTRTFPSLPYLAGLLPVLLLLSGRPAAAQSATESIREKAAVYLSASERADWETVADMLYPKLFEFSPREEVLSSLKQLETAGFRVRIYETAIEEITEAREHEGARYALLRYRMKMDMQLASDEWEGEEIIDLMKSQFEAMYGPENVSYEKDKKTFHVSAQNTMVALAPRGSSDWKFLEFNDTLEDFLVQILGQSLVDKLKAERG